MDGFNPQAFLGLVIDCFRVGHFKVCMHQKISDIAKIGSWQGSSPQAARRREDICTILKIGKVSMDGSISVLQVSRFGGWAGHCVVFKVRL